MISAIVRPEPDQAVGSTHVQTPYVVGLDEPIREFQTDFSMIDLMCRNYECWTETSEAVLKMAMIHIKIRRLA